MGIGQDMAPTACPGSDMADIVPVSSGLDTAEECMEPTSGTVRAVCPGAGRTPLVPIQIQEYPLGLTRRNSDVEPDRKSAKELLRVNRVGLRPAGHFRS